VVEHVATAEVLAVELVEPYELAVVEVVEPLGPGAVQSPCGAGLLSPNSVVYSCSTAGAATDAP
jgi:hypothetical protein